MNGYKFSINLVCGAGAAFLGLLSIAVIISAFLLAGNPAIAWLCLLFILLVVACAVLLVVFLRRKLVLFSDSLCRTIDDMLDGAAPPQQIHE
ncbi:MAG: sensor histidine kinase, partial [Lachnospiraceae bacterium]|nr:sensor histidine kinase [Lachnospiraceae bacterium]